jgi:hypothetical protein
MRFNGTVIDFKSSEDSFSAKKFNGEISFEFEKVDNKPTAIKIKSACEKGDIRISVVLHDRTESVTTGDCVIDISDCSDGKYCVKVKAKDAENVSLKYQLK